MNKKNNIKMIYLKSTSAVKQVYKVGFKDKDIIKQKRFLR